MFAACSQRPRRRHAQVLGEDLLDDEGLRHLCNGPRGDPLPDPHLSPADAPPPSGCCVSWIGVGRWG
eukprot:1293751-Pyramimonas_sp.AAC.1